MVQERILILETGCNKNKDFAKGFTLIEILIVLIIIGITSTLVILNFNSVSSIEKQTSGIEDSINFLTEESIITGKIIGLFVDPETQYALYLSNDNGKNLVKDFPNKGWDQNNSLKKTFQFLDGSIIEIGEKKYEIPLIIFYPSGENSGGVLNIYHDDYIQRVSIKNNGKILNEPISY